MERKKIQTIINEIIYPFSLTNKGKEDVINLINKYPYEYLIECINIGKTKYIKYDENNEVTKESVEVFVSKLGGIAYNRSLSKLDQKINHINNRGNKMFNYWDKNQADLYLHDYVNALSNYGWSEEIIIYDLDNEFKRMMNNCGSWSEWKKWIQQWINDIKSWENTTNIKQLGTIIPNSLFEGLQSNFQKICKQINASYENNLFDCTCVIMRRLLEDLLVLCFQNANIENEIINEKTGYRLSLEQIIRKAENSKELCLSVNTKRDMMIFKDLGNYSAHKIWYNCSKEDIRPHILAYRAIIEELLYKSGLKK